MLLLSKIEHWLCHYYLVFILLVFLLGLVFEELAKSINPYLLHILIVVMFFNFLKTDWAVLKSELKNWKYHLYFSSMSLLFVPVLLFFLTRVCLDIAGWDQSIAYGTLLLFSCPSAVLVVTMALLMKGNFERSIAMMFFTSLLAPISIPFLVTCFFPSNPIDPMLMILLLSTAILLPLGGALLFRSLFSRQVKIIQPHVPSFSMFLLLFVEFGALSGFKQILLSRPQFVFQCLIISMFTLVCAFVSGWFMTYKDSHKNRFTASLGVGWANIGLSIAVANEFFQSDPDILVFLVTMVVPWHSCILFVKFFQKSLRHTESLDSAELSV